MTMVTTLQTEKIYNYLSHRNYRIMKWFIKCLRQYADFSGRARRKEYWLFKVFYFLTFLVVALICALLQGMLNELSGGYHDNQSIFMIIPIIVYLGLIIPSLAVSVRRMHDVGMSGWFLLINLIPSIGGLIYFIFTLFDSQPYKNKWGSNPKEKEMCL